MTCRDYERRLAELEDYVNGEAADPRAIEGHLAACAACREAVDAARLAGALLRESLEPSPEASAAFWTRLGARLREEEATSDTAGDFWRAMEAFARRLAVSAAAAVLVLGAALIGTGIFQGGLVTAQQAEIRELVQRPAPPANHEEVLMSLANDNGGPERRGAEGKR
jgi:anti-sigma factor RsiW